MNDKPLNPDIGPGEKRLRQAIQKRKTAARTGITPSPDPDPPMTGTILLTLGRVEKQVNQLIQLVLTRLLSQLTESFDEEELRALCFELGVAYDDLPGDTRPRRARELITHCLHHGRIDQLLLIVGRERPHLHL